jgi:nondiscriminating aspartyl-tRNA synthetase
MERTHIKDLPAKIGQQVTIKGFAQTIRDQGNIIFIIVRDITGIIQAVVWKDAPEALETVKNLSMESVVAITGTVKEEKQAPGGLEVGVSEVKVLSAAAPELPIPVVEKDDNETDQAIRLDWRWIDLRKPKKLLVYQIWTTMEEAYKKYWTDNGYLQIHSPKMMSTPSESGAELFEVKYFDRKAYLAQSPQFYKQMAMAAGFEKVFEIGPVFRAEPSFTTRHATEYTGYDAEISYIESHEDVMKAHEESIAYVLSEINKKHGAAIKEHFGQEVVVPSTPFPRLTMAEAKALLQKNNVPSEREGDLSPEEERRLCELIKDERGHEFVFVTEYPITVRPFYHMRSESDPTVTKSFDLLWKGLEMTTGAQREHRYDVLCQQAQEKGMSLDSLEHYLNFFKYGCPPHGGFGHGPERFLMKLIDAESIRDISYLYRGVKRLTP